jgi:16S rRNA processing protein RimM
MAGIMHKLLGRITKIHGCEGTVIVKVERTFSDNIPPEMESIFLEIEGREVPFFIKHYQTFGHENILLRFEDYESVEKVKDLIGCKVFIFSGNQKGKSDTVQGSIIGFELNTIENELVGIITNVTENPGQWLITVVSNSGNEILVPFHEDLIIKIDMKSKKIIMTIPEGLDTLN